MYRTISLSLSVLTILHCASTTLAADWPQFLGPNRNSISTETGLIDAWPQKGPAVLWERPVGSGFSGPVVAGNLLILFHREGDAEVVECLHADTGKQQWKFAYPTHYVDQFGFDEGPRSTPLISGERVYTLGAEGAFHCLDLRTGQRIWSHQLNQKYEVPRSYFGVGTSPLLAGNLILLNVGGKRAGIVAFAADTGKEAWRATDHEASYSSGVLARLAGKETAVFFTREGIVFLDPANGNVRYQKHWRARINASVNAATPVAVNDHVFVSACYGTGAILLQAAANGVQETWKNDTSMSNHYGTCVQRDGYLYGFDGRQEEGAHLRCIELATGKVQWTCDKPGCGSILLAQNHLIVLTEHGELVRVAATPAGYDEKARAPVLGETCRAQIALANGRLYGRDTRKLVCWNLKK
jgi:outer membrane protein assembly factor BamB